MIANIFEGGDDLWRVFNLKGIDMDDIGEHKTWETAYARLREKEGEQP